jgi:hypothetical protein
MTLRSIQPLREISTRNLQVGDIKPTGALHWQPHCHLSIDCLKIWEPFPQSFHVTAGTFSTKRKPALYFCQSTYFFNHRTSLISPYIYRQSAEADNITRKLHPTVMRAKIEFVPLPISLSTAHEDTWKWSRSLISIYFSTRWRWLFKCILWPRFSRGWSLRYARLDRPQSLSGRCGEEQNYFSRRKPNPVPPALRLALYRLSYSGSAVRICL